MGRRGDGLDAALELELDWSGAGARTGADAGAISSFIQKSNQNKNIHPPTPPGVPGKYLKMRGKTEVGFSRHKRRLLRWAKRTCLEKEKLPQFRIFHKIKLETRQGVGINGGDAGDIKLYEGNLHLVGERLYLHKTDS